MAVYDQEIVDASPQYLQTKSYAAQKWRTWFADLAKDGVFSDSDFAITLLGGLAYRISSGKAYILGQQVADQGMYRMSSLANADLAVGAGHASLPRLDQVILRVMDNTHDGSGFNEGRIETVPGTATAGATLDNRSGAANLATLGEASKNVHLLYDILMPAAASSISAGNVRRRAQLARIGFGSMPDTIPLLTVAQFQALRDFPDGMEVYVLVDVTQRILWHLRYNASGGTYKWEAVGAQIPLFSEIATLESTTGVVYDNMTTFGPSFTLPLPGDYDIEIGGLGNFAGAGTALMSYVIGATAADDADSIKVGVAGAGSPVGNSGFSRPRRKAGLGAVAITAKYKNSGSSASMEKRWLRAWPIRVSQ